MNRHFASALVCALMSLFSLASFAQAPPAADSFVASGAAAANFGANTILAVQPNIHSYIRFDLSGIPANATVQKAVLRLFVDGSGATGAFDVYQLNAGWTEKTLTWNDAPPLGASATGGNPVTVTPADRKHFVVVDITPLVQSWVNGTVANNGLALALTSSSGSFSFDSKENSAQSHEPALEIAIPGAQGAQGPQGNDGPIGPMGSQGMTGPSGPQGPMGQTGATGATGPSGPQGPQGQTGAAGATGPQGMTGPTGPQGNDGPMGSMGATGPQGPQGLPGSTTLAYQAGGPGPGCSPECESPTMFIQESANFLLSGSVVLANTSEFEVAPMVCQFEENNGLTKVLFGPSVAVTVPLAVEVPRKGIKYLGTITVTVYAERHTSGLTDLQVYCAPPVNDSDGPPIEMTSGVSSAVLVDTLK